MRPIDADALMESIGCADAVKYGNRDRAQQNTSYSTMMLYEIRDEIDAQPTVGGWISVKDRMPEHVDRVPVLYRFTDLELQDGKLHTAMLWYVREPFCNDEPPHWERIGRYEYEVLYWFELPEPPEEVSRNADGA